MTAPTSSTEAPSPVTEHLLRQLEQEEAALGDPIVTPDALPDAEPGTDGTDPMPDMPSKLTELTGLETMDRPWRLAILGLGAWFGLGPWLVVVNGRSTLSAPIVSIAACLAALLVGLGLLSIANQRDRLGPTTNLLSAGVGVAYAALVWLNPSPLAGVDRWSLSHRVLSTSGAFAAGLLLAGVICMATIRRSPTLAAALSILAGVLVLAAVTVVRGNEWTGVVLFASAFFLILAAWDRSPRREVAFDRPPEDPRAVRACLSLLILALSGTAIDFARHGDNRTSGAGTGITVALMLIALALVVLFRLRSDIEDRDTRLSDWRSWMREIRTNEFRGGFEQMSRSPASSIDAPFADLGAPLPPESEQHVSQPPANDTANDAAEIDPSPIQRNDEAGTTTIAPPDASPEWPFDFEASSEPPSPPLDTTSPSGSFDFATAAGADEPPTDQVPVATHASITADPPRWADDNPAAEVPAIKIPRIEDENETDLPKVELYRAPRPTGTGTFSVFAQPEPLRLEVPNAEALATWLDANQDQDTLFIAVECMYLTSFTSLSEAYQTRVIAEVADRLRRLTPSPDPVAWIDGPYLIGAVRPFQRSDILALNRQLQALLDDTLTFDDVEIPLRGTLALLTPRATISFAELLDDAVSGLIQARNLES